MAKKKSDHTEASDERGELERRVDAMMSVEKPADKPAPKSKKPAEKASDDEPTAPQLPARLLKTIGGKSTIKIIPAEPEDAADDDLPADDTDKSYNNDPPTEPAADEQPSPEPAKAPTPPLPGDPLEDAETDEAVDDIVVQEADLQLAVDDVRTRRYAAEAELQNRRGLLATIFTSFWTWLIIIGIAGVVWAWFH